MFIYSCTTLKWSNLTLLLHPNILKNLIFLLDLLKTVPLIDRMKRQSIDFLRKIRENFFLQNRNEKDAPKKLDK